MKHEGPLTSFEVTGEHVFVNYVSEICVICG